MSKIPPFLVWLEVAEMDSSLHITGIFGKNLHANVQVPERIYSFVKKIGGCHKNKSENLYKMPNGWEQFCEYN